MKAMERAHRLTPRGGMSVRAAAIAVCCIFAANARAQELPRTAASAEAARTPTAASPSSGADDAVSERPTSLPQVDLSGKRQADPAVLPAKTIYFIQRAVDRYGDGLVEVQFLAYARGKKGPNGESEKVARKDRVPPTGLKIDVDTEDDVLPVKLDAKGLLILPKISEAAAEKAKLLSNQPKGSLALTLDFKLNVDESSLTPELLQRTNKAMDRVMAEVKSLLPWGFRWILPEVSGLALCQANGEPPATWVSSAGSQRIVYLYENMDKSKNCALLTGAQQLPPDAKLKVSGDAKLEPWMNGFTGRKSRL